MIRSRGTGVLGLVLVLTALSVLLPGIAIAETPFENSMRGARYAAAKRVKTTDARLGSGLFTYYTAGNSWASVGPNGWTSGYLPGELWATYSLNGDSYYSARAVKREGSLKSSVLTPTSTDIGMRFFYSHARAYQMTGSTASRSTALAAAGKEAARYDPVIGAIRSRPDGANVQVIIDELMNLEILYWGAENGGRGWWRDVAHQHARIVARDFVRPDGSVHHIITYSPVTGAVVGGDKGQGYSEDSMWSRGQAWAIHGFTNSYRHTGDPVLLDTARKVADRYLADVPADMVPYWDFRAPNIPDEPRDSSAAAIAASGLIDLATIDPSPENRVRYAAAAKATLVSLASPAYLSAGANPAILLHGTMNYHSGVAVDVGQSFGDYFFLEALQRARRLPAESPTLALRRVRASKGNPYRAIDGSMGTAWTSSGKQWLEFDLGSRQTVGAVSLAVAGGTTRSVGLKVYTSYDRKKWTLVSAARSSAETLESETYTFQPRRARYVRVVVNGTTRGRYNSITEAAVR